jgi:hypothetical protein
MPSSGAAFATDSRIEVYLNGQRMMHRSGAAAAVGLVGYTSSTQLHFGFPLFVGDIILIVAPDVY